MGESISYTPLYAVILCQGYFPRGRLTTLIRVIATDSLELSLEKIVRDGPYWGPDISVDVVVRIVDKESNNMYLLKASNQLIHGIY